MAEPFEWRIRQRSRGLTCGSRASRRRRTALFKRCYMIEFKPVKSEKTVISIRLDSNTLKEIDELSGKTDISRNELIVQCIDFALKHLKQ